jgi:hypothetical protein
MGVFPELSKNDQKMVFLLSGKDVLILKLRYWFS